MGSTKRERDYMMLIVMMIMKMKRKMMIQRKLDTWKQRNEGHEIKMHNGTV
jgi:hypothetical protein